MPEPGDLGRRVAQRRHVLGLSVEQLAGRTGMAGTYLEHLESSAVAMPDARALLKLAAALETSTAYLLGTGPHRPTEAPAAPGVETLDVEECWRLIAEMNVGRVVFDSERGPVAEPVNFGVADRVAFFRTDPGSQVDRLAGQEPVGLEVDLIDDALARGWSVLLTGRVRRAGAPEVERLGRAGVKPWSGREGANYLVLEPSEVTGRRINPSG